MDQSQEKGGSLPVILLGLLVWVAFGGITYLVADVGEGDLWKFGLFLGMIPMPMSVMAAYVFFAQVKNDEGEVKPLATGLICYGFLWITWVGVGWYFQRTTVFVDNYSGRNIRIRCDGEEWLNAKDRSKQKVRLLPSLYTFVLYDAVSGEELERVAADVDREGPFILNAMGAQVYRRGRVEYGKPALVGFGGDNQELEITGTWIRANYDYVFEQPPQKVSVARVQSHTTKTYLLRGKAEEGKPKP